MVVRDRPNSIKSNRQGGHARRHLAAAEGFSLVELVMVVVIIAVIAAIAIPRLSRSSEGAADAATSQNVAVLQKAVDHYAAEHGHYPDPDQVADQLTLFTDADGSVANQKAAPHTFGPYVRKLPVLTVGPNKGNSGIGPVGAAGIGWVYDGITGAVAANTGAGASATQPVSSPPTTSPVN